MTRSSINHSSITGLALALAAIAFTWGVLLPRLSKSEAVQEREAYLEEKKIDPAALFYSDLECLDDQPSPESSDGKDHRRQEFRANEALILDFLR